MTPTRPHDDRVPPETRVGAARAFAGVDASNPLTWLYLGGLLGIAGAMLSHPPERRAD